jgi:hypothetical protein
MGIIGKVLDEEVPGRSRYNIEYFTRFKRRHPEQVVLLHYNGNARDPRYEREGYFAGHWVYYGGCRIMGEVPAEQGISEIQVENTDLFRTGIGRYRQHNEDLGLCELDAEGKPNWHASEQVQLVSVDQQRNVIRVRRGCYETRVRSFAAGKAYAAAHASEGPWGRRSNLMWYYNYSTQCPRDAAGRTCAEVHAEELADRFAPHGELAAFDGLEFDVLSHRKNLRAGQRGFDLDADGQPDGVASSDTNAYGIGVIHFLELLRRKMGNEKLILADGHGPHHQRGFRVLNGIESEGWPALNDARIDDWSGGLNRHAFWAARGHAPAFNYINHKFVEPGDAPGVVRPTEVPASTHRLVFAAATFTDAAVCYSSAPRSEPGEQFGIWDELQMGREKKLAWLGRPLDPPIHLATNHPDLLEQADTHWNKRLCGEGVTIAQRAEGVTISSSKKSSAMRFTLPGVACPTDDLYVELRCRCEPRDGYPASMPRLLHVGLSAPGLLIQEDMESGMQLRGQPIQGVDTATGAALQLMQDVRLGQKTLSGLRVHPPYRGGTGYVFWQREVTVPRDAVLRFSTGMGPKAPGRSDGVVFAVEVTPADPSGRREGSRIFEHTQVASRWESHEVSLDRWGGRDVRLRFVADAGPNDNSTTDHAYWGAARIVRPGEPVALDNQQRYMSWVDAEAFTSRFYFSRLQPGQADLTFHIEGGEPVEIESISLHAAPDITLRSFTNGLVIANPAPHGATVDLAKLYPGNHFRRLQGSSQQDPETNDGSRVTAPLELAAKDALFLIRLP